MVVEVTKESADRCVKLLAEMFKALSKHDQPRLVGNAAVIESFLRAAGGCDDTELEVVRGEETKTAEPEPSTSGAGEAESIDPAASVSRKRR